MMRGEKYNTMKEGGKAVKKGGTDLRTDGVIEGGKETGIGGVFVKLMSTSKCAMSLLCRKSTPVLFTTQHIDNKMCICTT